MALPGWQSEVHMMLGVPVKVWILLAAVAIAFGSGWKFSRDHYLAAAASEKTQAEELAKVLEV